MVEVACCSLEHSLSSRLGDKERQSGEREREIVRERERERERKGEREREIVSKRKRDGEREIRNKVVIFYTTLLSAKASLSLSFWVLKKTIKQKILILHAKHSHTYTHTHTHSDTIHGHM